jgi:hypothetical protein
MYIEARSRIIVAVKKQYVLRICLCVRACIRVGAQERGLALAHACSLAYPAFNPYVLQYDVICGPSDPISFKGRSYRVLQTYLTTGIGQLMLIELGKMSECDVKMWTFIVFY